MEVIAQFPGRTKPAAPVMCGPNGETCGTCRYFLPHALVQAGEVTPGVCRRYPPHAQILAMVPHALDPKRMVPQVARAAPPMGSVEWCGEHAPALNS